jgi:chemotaxis signal transduction protein
MPMGPKGATATTVFDWTRALARIERSIAAIEGAASPAPEDVRHILRERAERYAKPPLRPSDAAVLDAIVFRLGDLRFGIEVLEGSAVASLANLTYVPGLPAFYMGVLSHRGGIYPVARLEPLLSIGQRQDHACRYAVLIRQEGAMLGLAADEVLGISRFERSAIALAPHESKSARIVYGVGPDSTTIILAGQLLMDARLVIDDQPDLSVVVQGSRKDADVEVLPE